MIKHKYKLIFWALASFASLVFCQLPAPVEPAATPDATAAPLDQPASATPTEREPLPSWTPGPDPTAAPLPTATPLHVTVKVITEEEIIFDWATDRCEDFQSADLPVRAFRTAEGLIQLILPFPQNFRMLGADFDSLEVDCNPIMQSARHYDPAKFDFTEWLASVYTEDGQTVHALVHNEFHGNEASRWHIFRDLSPEQGVGDWFYQYWNGSDYRPMSYRSGDHTWRGSAGLCLIGPGWMHPDVGCDPALTWISPQDGQITITGRYGDKHSDSGDGIIVSIHHNDEDIWNRTIEGDDTDEYKQRLIVDVVAGDAIYFRVNDRTNPGFDGVAFDPQINFGRPPCPDSFLGDCNYISITSAISTDGGQTFTHPPGPQHLIATWPFKFTIARGLWAMWQPSNIVKHPTDGYFYVLVQRDDVPFGDQGLPQAMCAMRTQDLSDPTSWRAWDGEGWNMRFINPYTETAARAADHICPAVASRGIGAMSYSLTYNTYLEKFIAVSGRVHEDEPGFYFIISDDLLNWSEPVFIMPAIFPQLNGWTPPYDAYGNLIDHDSLSMSFDTTGQRPYFYFQRFQQSAAFGVQVIRVQLEFQR
jgi:hypothetical protein